MPKCTAIDPLVTPYVDGELAAVDRQMVDQHLGVCSPCRARVTTERAVRDLVGARKRALTATGASPALRARCAAAWTVQPTPLRQRLMPLAMAASLVLLVGAAFLYPLTAKSSRVLAAELAVDHMKCFVLNGALGTRHSAAAVESELASSFGWSADLPDRPEQAGL